MGFKCSYLYLQIKMYHVSKILYVMTCNLNRTIENDKTHNLLE